MARITLFSILLALTFKAGAADLPASVRQALRSLGIPEANVGVVVQPAGEAHSLLSLNADEPRNPASVMKLVTTYAALELLGPAYRWRTEAYYAGTRSGDGLAGD